MSTPSTPLVTTRQSDEATPLIMPNMRENFAKDAATQDWIQSNLIQLIREAEDAGGPIRDEWLKVRRMTLLQHDQKGYNGISKAFIPAYMKAASARMSHTVRALFPSDQYLDVTTEKDGDDVFVEEAKAWMQFQMERRAKIRVNIKPFLRQLLDYGVSVAKVWWEQPITSVKKGSLVNVLTQGQFGNFGPAADVTGARFQARDIFSWYIWPNSAPDVQSASLVFEAITVDKQTFERMFKTGRWVNQDKVGHRAGTDDESNMYRQRMNDDLLFNTTTAVDTEAGELAQSSIVKECWLRMPVPNSLLMAGEEPGEPVPCKVVLANDIPVEVTRNPFWHQSAPYVFQTLEQRPDQFYGMGLGRMGLELQTQINDVSNQTNDVARYGLNPIVKMNPSLMVGPTPALGPGKVYHMTDPTAMTFDRPPIEQMQWGLMQKTNLQSDLNDLLGAPPQNAGGDSRSKTATGSQILQANVKTDLQDIVEDTELLVLIPTMEMIYSLGQQFEKSDVWVAITGGKPIQVRREAFTGQYRMRWMASSQTANQQVRGQQALAFLQSLPAILPLLQAQGKTIDPIPVLRRLYADSIGGRDFDAIIKALPMPMQGMMPPGAAGAAPGQPGLPQEPRSAAEQAAGGGEPMVPGEGEDFMTMRQGVEEQTAASAGVVSGGPMSEEELYGA